MGFSNRLPLRPTYWTLVQPFGHTEEGSSITSHGERRRFKYLTNTIWHYTKPRSIYHWIIKSWIEYLFTKLQRILWWMYKLYAVDLFFLMILSNCWSILTSRQATGAGAKCLSVPRALFLTPWWAGSDEQVDVLTFWRFLSPSLPSWDGRWKSGPPMRFTSVILGRCSNNQNGNLRWYLPLGTNFQTFFTPLFSFAIESYIYETDFTHQNYHF